MRRLTYFVFGSYIVGAIVVFAALVASAYLVTPVGAASVVRVPVHAAMLDIIRCSPPTHPDGSLQNTAFAPRSGARHQAAKLLQRVDIFDPSDCGRVITQALSPAIAPANRAHSG